MNHDDTNKSAITLAIIYNVTSILLLFENKKRSHTIYIHTSINNSSFAGVFRILEPQSSDLGRSLKLYKPGLQQQQQQQQSRRNLFRKWVRKNQESFERAFLWEIGGVCGHHSAVSQDRSLFSISERLARARETRGY